MITGSRPVESPEPPNIDELVRITGHMEMENKLSRIQEEMPTSISEEDLRKKKKEILGGVNARIAAKKAAKRLSYDSKVKPTEKSQ